MTDETNTNAGFRELLARITEDEQALRDHFADTPSLSPASLQQIKDRLRVEAAHMQSTRSAGSAWLRFLAATAATILLAAGLRFSVIPGDSLVDPADLADGTEPTRLDALASSVPNVLAEEDTELRQLQSELWQLEMQAAGDAADLAEPGDPAAQRNRADNTASLTMS